MATIIYRKEDVKDLTAGQAQDWLSVIQGLFGSSATAASIKTFYMYRTDLAKSTLKALLTLQMSGTAEQYAAAKKAHGAILKSDEPDGGYDGTTAVWLEKHFLNTTPNQPLVNLLADVHPGISASTMYQLTLVRGSPNVSQLIYKESATPHDWTAAEAAGTPLGAFLEVV